MNLRALFGCMAGALLAFPSAAAVTARYVTVDIPQDSATLSLSEVEVFSAGKNVARNGKAIQSSTMWEGNAARAIDGNTSDAYGSKSITHTAENVPLPTWELDLGAEYPVDKIVLWNRGEGLTHRLNGVRVTLSDVNRNIIWRGTRARAERTNAFDTCKPMGPNRGTRMPTIEETEARLNAPAKSGPVTARYVVVDIPAKAATLSLSEVEVFSQGNNVARKGKAVQSTTAWDGVASRAIDGNTSDGYGSNSITHTLEDQPNPTWELDLGAEVPVDKVVLWNRGDGFGHRLNGARVTLADKNRNIVWYKAHGRAERRNEFNVSEKGMGLRSGTRLLTFEELAEQARVAAMIAQMNPKALTNALNAYADLYPEVYTDREKLLKDIAEIAQAMEDGEVTVDQADRYRELQKLVLLRHPAIDFKEILFIKRQNGTKQGLFANWTGNSAWQGNTNSTLRGYNNALMRGPLCQDDAKGGKATELLRSSAFLGDLCLDWDASRMLLSSGEENGGPWGLYEFNLNDPKGTWHKAFEDSNPQVDYYDGCYLPDGRIISVASIGFQGVPCVNGGDFVGNLHLIAKDRKSSRRLTFDQDNNWNPEVYPDGRVHYLRWEYTDSAHYFSRVMMTMNPDGTDQKEYYGSNSYWPNSIFFHQHIPGTTKRFVGIVSGHHGEARKGELVKFDVTKGRHETQGAVHKFPFRGKPIENITKDQLVNGKPFYFLHPRALSEDLVLCAMEYPGTGFKLVLVDTYDNVMTLWECNDGSLYEPIPIRATKRPVARPDRVNLNKKTCNVYMSDVYVGQKTLEGVPRGGVKKLRVFNYIYAPRMAGGHYAIGMEGPWDVRVLHGTVDVEPDGSCMFEFPANTPLAIQPLDEDGNALQMMRSWLVGMPGETVSCIGCHESQNMVPPTGSFPAASRKPPQKITPWYGPARGWSFDREVQPVLDRKCAGCHNGKNPMKNAMGQSVPNLSYLPQRWNSFSQSYIDLHPYVRRNGPEGDYHVLTPLEFHTSTSELVHMLKKGHHGVKLDKEEWDRLQTWIDLNVPYYGTWTERGARRDMMALRQEYGKRTANLDVDPEVIVNPYKPGTVKFEAPKCAPKAGEIPTVAGWPFDGAKARSGKTVTVDVGGGHTITAVEIPAGAFVMGSNCETPAEMPAHKATVDKPFYMGTTEVTMGMMKQFDAEFENGVYDMHYKDQVRRGYFVNNDAFPAIRVSYNKAVAFCKWLSEKSGKTVRLPTEIEWEYACRAGSATPMNYGGINDNFGSHANLADIQMKKLAVVGVDPQPLRNPDQYWDFEKKDPRVNDGVLHLAKVGSYKPNAFGLYDMHGNVAEWTSSPFTAYPGGPGSEAFDAGKNVVRGGSWHDRQIRATSSWRWAYPVWMRPYNVGFRVVIEE